MHPQFLPRNFRGAAAIRESLWRTLFANGVCDIHVQTPPLQHHRYGIKAERYREKLMSDFRRRIDQAVRRWPFIAGQEMHAGHVRYRLDADAMHDPHVLAQALVAYGTRALAAMESDELLPMDGEASRYTRRVRELLHHSTSHATINTARGDVGEAALRHVVSGLIQPFQEGDKGQLDVCWFEQPVSFTVGAYAMEGIGANVFARLGDETQFEKDALVLQGDGPDVMTLLDATTSELRVHEKLETDQPFSDFRAVAQEDGIDAQTIHVFFDDDLEGWCDIGTGEGTAALCRAFRQEIDQALALGTQRGVHVVALPHREKVADALDAEIQRARRMQGRFTVTQRPPPAAVRAPLRRRRSAH